MFNLSYVVVSMIYRKAFNFLVGARKTYPTFFKDIFDKNRINLSVFLFNFKHIYIEKQSMSHYWKMIIIYFQN